MEAYVLSISRVKLSETNKIWNESRLNKPWVVGSTSTLINSQSFDTKEEWREFYFESGRIRQEKIAKMRPFQRKKILRTLQGDASYSERQFNLNHGRTKEELYFIGDLFHAEIQKKGNPLGITKAEARYMVLYRVIGETWNGIGLTEPRIRKSLQSMLNWNPRSSNSNDFLIKKVSEKVDGIFEVDAEVFVDDKLVCGIQIKPISYKSLKFDHAKETERINAEKNGKYEEKFKVPVLYVFGDKKGRIKNTEIVREIKKIKAEAI